MNPPPELSRSTTIAAALAKFIAGAFALSLSPLLPDVMGDLQAGPDRLGLAGGIYGLAGAAMAVCGAPMQDRIPRMVAIRTGVSGHIIGLLTVAFAVNWQMVVIGHLMCGLAIGFLLPALVAHLSDLTPFNRRAQTLSRTNTGWAMSTLVGVPLSAVIGALVGWRAMPILLILLWVVVLLLLGRPLPLRTELREEASLKSLDPQNPGSYPLGLMTVTFLGFTGFYGLYPYIGIAFRADGAGAAGAGALVACYGAGFMVATALGGFIDRIGPRRVLAGSLTALSFVLGAITILITRSFLTAAAGMFAWGVLQNLFFTSVTTLVSNVSAVRRGFALALNQAALSIGLGVGTAVMGVVLANSGFVWVGAISAGSTLLAATFAYRVTGMMPLQLRTPKAAGQRRL